MNPQHPTSKTTSWLPGALQPSPSRVGTCPMVNALRTHRHWCPTGTKIGTRCSGPPWSRPQFTPATAGAFSEVLLFTHKAARFGRQSTHFPGLRQQWNSPFSQARWHRCQVTDDLFSRPAFHLFSKTHTHPCPSLAAVVFSRIWVQEDFAQDHFSCQALPQPGRHLSRAPVKASGPTALIKI